MRKRHVICGWAAALWLGWCTGAGAVTIQYETGTVWTIGEVLEVGTYGDDMAGMEVRVTFADGTSDSAVWQVIGPDSGMAAGDGWSLSVIGGSTYPNSSHWTPWIFASDTAITSLSLDVGSGDFVFDATRTYASDPPGTSTPHSQSGWPFTYADPLSELWFDSATVATYTNAVALPGADPVGDLYRTLTLDFDLGGWSGPMAFTFEADTDTVSPVPEPATFLLMGSGLAAVAGWRRRNRDVS